MQTHVSSNTKYWTTVDLSFFWNIFLQESIYSNWLPMSKSQIPDPRPGLCYNDTYELPESSLNFIKHHSLMDWAVPTATPGPLFVRTSMGERLTMIAVDPQVETIDGEKVDVLFVGTTTGRVLKVINRKSEGKALQGVLVESMQVINAH